MKFSLDICCVVQWFLKMLKLVLRVKILCLVYTLPEIMLLRMTRGSSSEMYSMRNIVHKGGSLAVKIGLLTFGNHDYPNLLCSLSQVLL
jgi:hypothetical protein